MKTKNAISYMVFNSALLFICLSIVFKIHSSRTNTLFKNGNWVSSKTQLNKVVPGAFGYVLSPYALAGGKLNLSAWHGYQQVFYDNPVTPQNLELDFKLTRNSYLIVLFYRHEDTLAGIRISNDPAFPDMLFQAYKGRFIKKVPIRDTDTHRWNHLELAKTDDQSVLYVNGIECSRFSNLAFPMNTVGFSGCRNKVFIDNISILDQHTNGRILENFEALNSGHCGLFIKLMIAGILIIGALYFTRNIYAISLVMTVAALITILFWGVYVLKLQYSYPKSWVIYWKGYDSDHKEEKSVHDRIGDLLASGDAPSANMILFIGSSQTWGAGASDDAFTLVNQFEKLLNERFGNDVFTCVNAGVSGATSTDLFQFYESEWIKLDPELVIINLSNNDGNAKVLRSQLYRFIAFNKDHDIETCLVLEVNDVDSRPITANHEVMRAIAVEEGLIAVDMHSALAGRSDEGLLYWDGVHLSDFGYELMAEILFAELVEHIESRHLPAGGDQNHGLPAQKP